MPTPLVNAILELQANGLATRGGLEVGRLLLQVGGRLPLGWGVVTEVRRQGCTSYESLGRRQPIVGDGFPDALTRNGDLQWDRHRSLPSDSQPCRRPS
jgi:hypothetical protein